MYKVSKLTFYNINHNLRLRLSLSAAVATDYNPIEQTVTAVFFTHMCYSKHPHWLKTTTFNTALSWKCLNMFLNHLFQK